jgi:hypothetical protein
MKKTTKPCANPPCREQAKAPQVAGTTTALSWCKLRGMQRKAAGKK